MNCTKRLNITGYTVKYYDCREPKPRQIREEIYIMDSEAKAALALLGLDMTDFIRNRYERGGYCCCNIERIKGCREIRVDLRQCWEDAQTESVNRERAVIEPYSM